MASELLPRRSCLTTPTEESHKLACDEKLPRAPSIELMVMLQACRTIRPRYTGLQTRTVR